MHRRLVEQSLYIYLHYVTLELQVDLSSRLSRSTHNVSAFQCTVVPTNSLTNRRLRNVKYDVTYMFQLQYIV